MSLYDTLEVDSDAPLPDHLADKEWQVHINSETHSFRIDEDMELLVSKMGLKDGVELGEDDPLLSEHMEQRWEPYNYSGTLTLRQHGHEPVQLLVEEGSVTARAFPN